MGCCWSDSRSEVEVPQPRRSYEGRRTLVTPRVSTTYVPATYVPTNRIPSFVVPSSRIPARVPSPVILPARVPSRVSSPAILPARVPSRVSSPAILPARVPSRVSSPVVPVLRVPVPLADSVAVSPKHCYGEYKCVCGRFWHSTLSWPKSPQGCQKCERNVYPHTQRELRPEDFKGDQADKHMEELCPKCKELGRHCGYLRKPTNNNNIRSKYNNHCQNNGYSDTKRKRLGYHCTNSNRHGTQGFKSIKSRY